MSQRRTILNDHLMFVTVVTRKREPFFRDPVITREAIDTLYRVQELHPFFLYGFVFMPDHAHFLLRIPAPETISRVMRVYKYGTSLNCGKGPLWQPRYHIRLPDDSVATRHYIHWNPAKAGIVELPEHYPWSSASGKWDVSDLLCWL